MPKRSLDVLILFLLVLARVQIDDLADLVLPDRLADTRQLLAGWWPGWSLDILAHPQTDQASMMLTVTAFGLLGCYFLAEFLGEKWPEQRRFRVKITLLCGIIILLVFGKTALLTGLRQLRGPASYAHDGGVIQTEITIDYFLNGQNPYVDDYVDTAMAEWGLDEYRTALYHYPYLPWTFIFATPAYLAAQATLGWFDMRLVYLPLVALTLLLTQSLVKRHRDKLIAVALIGLNPRASLDLIFGVNDPFVFFWIILALWLVKQGQDKTEKQQSLYRLLGSAAFGLACASKPTAWFLAPFWLLYLSRDYWGTIDSHSLKAILASWRPVLATLWRRTWTLPVTALLIIGPWFVWNPDAMYDDVWRWSAGQGETGYQIWGWGASNYVLAFGLVDHRFEYWPFIIPGLLVGVPLLWFLLRRQLRHNNAGAMLFHYALFLFVFFYISRFMQPNYLGFILSILTLAYFVPEADDAILPSNG